LTPLASTNRVFERLTARPLFELIAVRCGTRKDILRFFARGVVYLAAIPCLGDLLFQAVESFADLFGMPDERRAELPEGQNRSVQSA
jgi:hypothetical protein